MKRKLTDLTEQEKIKTLDMLYTAASTMRGRQAIKLFLRDLLTPSERIMLGRRIMIARLLIAGGTHKSIARRIGVGMGTIQRVERWLDDQFPGYEEAIIGAECEFKKRAWRAEADHGPFSFSALKRKYPLHFLLFSEPKKKKR